MSLSPALVMESSSNVPRRRGRPVGGGPALVMESGSNVPMRRGRPVGGSGSVGSRKKTKEEDQVIKEEGGANPSVAMELKVLDTCVLAPNYPLSLSVPPSPSLVMESSSNVPRRRGRPVGEGGSAGSREKTEEGSGKVIKEAGANPSVAMELKVLEVASGSDVIAAVYDFAKRYQVDVGIISAYGMVSNITIYQPQPFPDFPIRKFNHLYHLVSIKGSFYGSVNSIRPPPSFDRHFVSFTGCDGQYHAGIIRGGITAVNNVVLGVSLIRGTTCSIKLPLPRALSVPQPLFPAQNEDMPTEPFGLNEIFSGTERSMTAFGVPSVAPPANLNVRKSPASGFSSTSFFK